MQALQDFVTEVGAPYRIMNDNAEMEVSEAWKKILRTYNIDRGTTERYHPQQNPAERRIQEIKKVSLSIMNHSNTTGSLSWPMATKYTIMVLNHTKRSENGIVLHDIHPRHRTSAQQSVRIKKQHHHNDTQRIHLTQPHQKHKQSKQVEKGMRKQRDNGITHCELCT